MDSPGPPRAPEAHPQGAAARGTPEVTVTVTVIFTATSNFDLHNSAHIPPPETLDPSLRASEFHAGPFKASPHQAHVLSALRPVNTLEARTTMTPMPLPVERHRMHTSRNSRSEHKSEARMSIVGVGVGHGPGPGLKIETKRADTGAAAALGRSRSRSRTKIETQRADTGAAASTSWRPRGPPIGAAPGQPAWWRQGDRPMEAWMIAQPVEPPADDSDSAKPAKSQPQQQQRSLAQKAASATNN